MDGQDGQDFRKSRSFPLISVRLSRALGREVGKMGAARAVLEGDIDGFGGQMSGFGARFLGVWK